MVELYEKGTADIKNKNEKKEGKDKEIKDKKFIE